jgi:hypothetical protein
MPKTPVELLPMFKRLLKQKDEDSIARNYFESRSQSYKINLVLKN